MLCVAAAAEAAEAVEAVAVADAEEPQPWAQTTAAVEDRRCVARACKRRPEPCQLRSLALIRVIFEMGGWGKNGQRWSQTVKSSLSESKGALPALAFKCEIRVLLLGWFAQRKTATMWPTWLQ